MSDCQHPNKKYEDDHCYASGGGYTLYSCPDCGKHFKEYLGSDLKTVLPTKVVKFDHKPTEEDIDKALADFMKENKDDG